MNYLVETKVINIQYKMKMVGDKVSACLSPLLIFKKELKKLLLVMQHLGSLYIILIKSKNLQNRKT